MIKAIALLALMLTPTITATLNKEINCLATNVYFEARGESQQGKLAVALVTLNRVADKNRPKSICDVVYQSRQFSWTRNRKLGKIDPQQWLEAREAAVAAYANRNILGDFPATHYHNLTVNPNWKLKRVAKIGNHVFYV